MGAWRATVTALRDEKVQFVFGLPGSVKNLYEDLYDFPEIKPILVRHETSGAFMAYAVGRLTGRPGVCHGTDGPGVANLVPGILEAYAACIPIVSPCPVAQLEAEGMGALQETDQISLMRPITKWSFRVSKPERIPWVMRRAFFLAANGKPGPVFIEIPIDVALKRVDMPNYIVADIPIRSSGDPARINEAVNLLLKSERPVIVAGGGLVLSRAYGELMQFAEMLGIPILTTASGRGAIPEDHPLSCGLVGLYRTKIGKAVFEESDLIISLGCRFEELESGRWLYWPHGAKFIQVDVDAFEIGRNWIPDVGIIGDAKIVLKQLIDELGGRISRKKLSDMPRVSRLIKAKSEYESEIERECKTSTVRTKMVIRVLSKVFGKNTILVNENGAADLWSYYSPYYKVLDVGDCVTVANQTCMGIGVAGSIAAKLVMPHKKVVCVTGDGAFQMFMKELPTAVQYKAPVTWVVLNDFSLGWPKYGAMVDSQGKNIASDFEIQPDFSKIAEANKCFGQRVDKASDVEDSIRSALNANEEGTPAVLDFIIQPFDYNEFFREFHVKVWGFDPEKAYQVA